MPAQGCQPRIGVRPAADSNSAIPRNKDVAHVRVSGYAPSSRLATQVSILQSDLGQDQVQDCEPARDSDLLPLRRADNDDTERYGNHSPAGVTTKARLLDLVAELETAGVEVESSSYVVGTKGDLYSIWARWGSGRILLRTAKQVREHVARLAV